MGRRVATAAVLVLCLWLSAVPRASGAEDVLGLVPEQASAVVVINHPAVIEARLQALGRTLNLPVLGRLAMLKQQLNLGQGLDESRAAALVVLAPKAGSVVPPTILLLPVTDYSKFLAGRSRQAAEDEISTVNLLGSTLLVRSVGGYAAVTDKAQRETLASLEPAKEITKDLAAWREWLAAGDIAAVLLRPGIEQFSTKLLAALEQLKSSIRENGELPEATAAGIDVYAKMLQAANREVASLGLRVELDRGGALRAAGRMSLVPDGAWARLTADLQPPQAHLLLGYPNEPFVFVGGTAVSEPVSEAITLWACDLMRAMPSLYGLNEKQIDKMWEISAKMLNGCRSFSLMLGAGGPGEPIYSHALGTMWVEDSNKFMDNYGTALKQYAEFLEGENSPILKPMKVARGDLAGSSAWMVTMPIASLRTGMPAAEEKVMKSLFGAGETINAYIAPIDSVHVMVGYVNPDRLVKAIQAARRGEADLWGSADMKRMSLLMPEDALAVAYVNPRGVIEFVRQTLVPPEVKEGSRPPEFPETLPIGFAITKWPMGLDANVVVPEEVLQAIQPYLGLLQRRASDRTITSLSQPPAATTAPATSTTPPKHPRRTTREPLTLDIARFHNVPERHKHIVEPYYGGHVIDGLPFVVGGEARLWGETVYRRTPDYPMSQSFSGIDVGRTFDELHLIHCAMWPDLDGQTVAYMVLNYDDGQKAVLPIRYGVHVLDWMLLPSNEQDLPTDKDTKVCWRHPPVMYKAPIRLFKTQLMNPLPDKLVQTIDIVSARARTMYTLIAATVADSESYRPASPGVPADEPERKFDGRLTIRVVDSSSGEPIAGALVDPGMSVRGEGVVAQPFLTSADGQGMLRYPTAETASVYVQVMKDGYQRQSRNWSGDIPDSATFELRPDERMPRR
jgi:hypothetical protein